MRHAVGVSQSATRLLHIESLPPAVVRALSLSDLDKDRPLDLDWGGLRVVPRALSVRATDSQLDLAEAMVLLPQPGSFDQLLTDEGQDAVCSELDALETSVDAPPSSALDALRDAATSPIPPSSPAPADAAQLCADVTAFLDTLHEAYVPCVHLPHLQRGLPQYTRPRPRGGRDGRCRRWMRDHG